VIYARVAGSITSTINHPDLDGRRLLVCDKLTPDGKPAGGYLIAVDTVGAGAGETVIILVEATGPVRSWGARTPRCARWWWESWTRMLQGTDRDSLT